MSRINPPFDIKVPLVVRIGFRFKGVSYTSGDAFPPKGVKASRYQLEALQDCCKLWPKSLYETDEQSKKAKELAAKPEEKQEAAVKAPAKPKPKAKAKSTPKDKPKAKSAKAEKAEDKQAKTDASTAKPWDK